LLTLSEKELDQIRGKELAMIFQNVMASLNPVFTIGYQLTETIKVHLGYDKIKAKSYAISLLEKVGLSEPESVYRKFPHMLSGGMRQRVMIAMAIACHPKLIIADEPTTALDVTIQMQIIKLLLELRKENGMSIILITHDIGLIAELADRVMVMYAGQIVEESSVDALFTEARHPYTQALLKAIPTIEGDKEKKLYAIPGTVPENYQEIEGCRFADRCPYTVGRCLEKQEYRNILDNHFIRCHMTSFEGKEI
ncbi:MAG: ABC transporter ATP-binding protein, partial [Clostridiales bacterium]|nr:ABC transporter ATP-binding protein [Clostridiales bacterium]